MFFKHQFSCNYLFFSLSKWTTTSDIFFSVNLTGGEERNCVNHEISELWVGLKTNSQLHKFLWGMNDTKDIRTMKQAKKKKKKRGEGIRNLVCWAFRNWGVCSKFKSAFYLLELSNGGKRAVSFENKNTQDPTSNYLLDATDLIHLRAAHTGNWGGVVCPIFNLSTSGLLPQPYEGGHLAQGKPKKMIKG